MATFDSPRERGFVSPAPPPGLRSPPGLTRSSGWSVPSDPPPGLPPFPFASESSYSPPGFTPLLEESLMMKAEAAGHAAQPVPPTRGGKSDEEAIMLSMVAPELKTLVLLRRMPKKCTQDDVEEFLASSNFAGAYHVKQLPACFVAQYRVGLALHFHEAWRAEAAVKALEGFAKGGKAPKVCRTNFTAVQFFAANMGDADKAINKGDGKETQAPPLTQSA